MLSSDEDDIDDEGEEYLEHLQKKINAAKSKAPFDMTADMTEVNWTLRTFRDLCSSVKVIYFVYPRNFCTLL